MASASGVRKCRSTARFSGRAPRSGVKPCVEQELQRRVVELDRPLRARAARAARAPPPARRARISRITGARQRPEDDRAVDPVEELRPERLRVTACSTLRRGEPPVAGEKPSPAPVATLAPRFEVMMITRVAEVGRLAARVAQPAVVEHLQEQVPDARVGLLELVEQHDGERLAADRADQRARPRASRVAEHPPRASPGSGTRSCRAGSSGRGEPNRYSASALAISVLPVPVGPTNSSTACGRVGIGQPRLDQRDPLDHALDRLGLADHAARRRTRAARRRRAARARPAATAGSPERSVIVAARRHRQRASPPARRVASSSESSAPGSARVAEEVAAERERLAQHGVVGAAARRARRARACAARRSAPPARRRTRRAAPAARAAAARSRPASTIAGHVDARVRHARAAAGRATPPRVLAGDARVQQRLELGTIHSTRSPASVLHEWRMRALELADVGHARVDLGRARLERHPAVGAASRPAAPQPACGRPLPRSPTHQQRLAPSDRRRPARRRRGRARRRRRRSAAPAPRRAPDAADPAAARAATPAAASATQRARERASRRAPRASASAASTCSSGRATRDRLLAAAHRDRRSISSAAPRHGSPARANTALQERRADVAVERAQQEDAALAARSAPGARTAPRRAVGVAPRRSASSATRAASASSPRAARAAPRRRASASATACWNAGCASSAAARRSALGSARSVSRAASSSLTAARPAPRRARARRAAPCSSATSR